MTCTQWTGSLQKDGYGRVKIKNKYHLAHRVAFEKANGFLPPVVMHTCDNRACVNPAHLVSGTHLLNNQDCIAKGRNWWMRRTHCKNGHAYVEGSFTVVRGNERRCKQCRKEFKR